MASIEYHSEGIEFRLHSEKKTSLWIERVFREFKLNLLNINYIFCSDDYLLEVNQKHLNHNYYTDIITFDFVEGKDISGDMFISIDRVKDNAKHLNVSFQDELDRVMVHGLLHLFGYKDKSIEEANEIRAQEDFCLTLRSL